MNDPEPLPIKIRIRAHHVIDALTVAAALATLWAQAIYNGLNEGTLLLLIFVWPIVAIVWLGRVLKWLFNRSRPPLKKSRRHLGLFPALALPLYLASRTDWPMRTTFWLHRPLLERMATHVLAARTSGERERRSRPHRVGFYLVSDVEKIPGGVRFAVASEGETFDTFYFGFTFCPSGKAHTWYDSQKDSLSYTTTTFTDGPIRLNRNWYWWGKRVSFND